jgi:hypothetical protein
VVQSLPLEGVSTDSKSFFGPRLAVCLLHEPQIACRRVREACRNSMHCSDTEDQLSAQVSPGIVSAASNRRSYRSCEITLLHECAHLVALLLAISALMARLLQQISALRYRLYAL